MKALPSPTERREAICKKNLTWATYRLFGFRKFFTHFGVPSFGLCHSEARGKYMTDRIRFITHQRKQILLVDLSGCSATELEKTIRSLPEIVTTRPRGSVLILTDFGGASLDLEAIRTLKETAVFDKPYVKKSAWVGTERIPKVFSDELRKFSRRDFPVFESREEALSWLVTE
jgi:hypothetical protein